MKCAAIDRAPGARSKSADFFVGTRLVLELRRCENRDIPPGVSHIIGTRVLHLEDSNRNGQVRGHGCSRAKLAENADGQPSSRATQHQRPAARFWGALPHPGQPGRRDLPC